MAIADWYFDFVSPFSYIQCERLPALAPRLQVRCKPVLFGAILTKLEHKGPAEIDGKRTFTYQHAYWQARALGIPMKFPHVHPFNPLPLLRLAIGCDSTFAAVQQIFRFVWRDGRLPDLPIEWAELAQALGVHDPDARIAAPEVKDELKRNTDEALARGVFGVPTLALGGALFWGNDATDMAVDYVARGCRWDDPEYARIVALPTGVQRKR
ncbi:MAG: 2-hydroxychromene-2-carboxylate isomerase [Proteobacteria bacterium]|nr:2-hydroxychromene-2-carboxylate isomerase [Pseudomonadota bacterium]